MWDAWLRARRRQPITVLVVVADLQLWSVQQGLGREAGAAAAGRGAATLSAGRSAGGGAMRMTVPSPVGGRASAAFVLALDACVRLSTSAAAPSARPGDGAIVGELGGGGRVGSGGRRRYDVWAAAPFANDEDHEDFPSGDGVGCGIDEKAKADAAANPTGAAAARAAAAGGAAPPTVTQLSLSVRDAGVFSVRCESARANQGGAPGRLPPAFSTSSSATASADAAQAAAGAGAQEDAASVDGFALLEPFDTLIAYSWGLEPAARAASALSASPSSSSLPQGAAGGSGRERAVAQQAPAWASPKVAAAAAAAGGASAVHVDAIPATPLPLPARPSPSLLPTAPNGETRALNIAASQPGVSTSAPAAIAVRAALATPLRIVQTLAVTAQHMRLRLT